MRRVTQLSGGGAEGNLCKADFSGASEIVRNCTRGDQSTHEPWSKHLVRPIPSHGIQIVMSSSAPHPMANVMVTRRRPNVLVGCTQRHSIGHGRNGYAPQARSMQRPFQLLRFFVFAATVPLQILFILDEQCIEYGGMSRRMSPLRPAAVYSIIVLEITDAVCT
jgi:hypothetical protein